MKNIEHETRRSFLKKFASGTALVVAGLSSKSGTARAGGVRQTVRDDEIMYRETEEFRDYYRSLKD